MNSGRRSLNGEPGVAGNANLKFVVPWVTDAAGMNNRNSGIGHVQLGHLLAFDELSTQLANPTVGTRPTNAPAVE